MSGYFKANMFKFSKTSKPHHSFVHNLTIVNSDVVAVLNVDCD